MSIDIIKSKVVSLNNSSLFGLIKTSPAFGNTTIMQELKELFALIGNYEEPKPVVKSEPKPKARRTRAVKRELEME